MIKEKNFLFCTVRRLFPVDFTYRHVGISYRCDSGRFRTIPRKGLHNPLRQNEYNTWEIRETGARVKRRGWESYLPNCRHNDTK